MENEILRATELSIVFVGVIMSLIVAGLSFFLYHYFKRYKKELAWMGLLIFAWGIFLILHAILSEDHYHIFSISIPANIIAILVGLSIVIYWAISIRKYGKKFDKTLMKYAGTFAILGILQKIICLFYTNVQFQIINKTLLTIPPILGVFMIIKLAIKSKK